MVFSFIRRMNREDIIMNLQFDEWSQRLLNNCGHYFGIPVSKTDEPQGHFNVLHSYGLDIMDIATNAEQIKRTQVDVKKDEIEYIYLLKQIKGTTIASHNNKTSLMEPGDFFLLDSTKSVELNYQGNFSHFMSIHLPRKEFLDWCHWKIEIGSVCKSNQLQGKALNVAFPEGNFYDDLVSENETDFLFDLARIAFFKEKEHTSVLRYSNRLKRFAAIKHIVDQNITNPELSLELLSVITKMSTRQLQRDFKDQGTTFSNFLNEKRLQLSIQKLKLANQSLEKPNITCIAFSCGFGDVSNFNRKFKNRFGCSPTEYYRNQLQ